MFFLKKIVSEIGNVLGNFYFNYVNSFHLFFPLIGPYDLALIPIGAYEPRKLLQAQHICPEGKYK